MSAWLWASKAIFYFYDHRQQFWFIKSMKIDEFLALGFQGHISLFWPCLSRRRFSFIKYMKIDEFLALGLQSHTSIFWPWLSRQRFSFIYLIISSIWNQWVLRSGPPGTYFNILTTALKTTIFLHHVYENRWVLGSGPRVPFFNILTMDLKTTIFLYEIYVNILWDLRSGPPLTMALKTTIFSFIKYMKIHESLAI